MKCRRTCTIPRLIIFQRSSAPPLWDFGVLTGAWAFGHPDTMAGLLTAEGVTFDAKGRVLMKVHAWDPLTDLSDDERATILEHAPAEFASLPDVSNDLPAQLRRDLSGPFKLRPE